MEALITPAAKPIYHSGKKCRRINCLRKAGRGQYLCQAHSDERAEKIFRSFSNLPGYTTNT